MLSVPSALISDPRCWLQFSYYRKKKLTFHGSSLPRLRTMAVVRQPLLMVGICAQINHHQSRIWPWSGAQPEEELLSLTRQVLVRWHSLIDPRKRVKQVSLRRRCRRVIACSSSDHRGHCQNYQTACTLKAQVFIPEHYWNTEVRGMQWCHWWMFFQTSKLEEVVLISRAAEVVFIHTFTLSM